MASGSGNSRVSRLVHKSSSASDIMASLTAARAAATYFDKIEKCELQETLAYSLSDWLLSTEDTRVSVEPPQGLITGIQISSSMDNCLLLIPEVQGFEPLELREMHQIVRELVTGLYILNQAPSISLEANFDCSTSCQIPPAYLDTRVGQIMCEVDYMMKSLWHGAYFPKDKRSKFAERWRQAVNLNTTTGEPETRRSLQLVWTEAGIMDLSADPLFAEAYANMPVENKEDPRIMEERHYFMKHLDELALKMTISQKSINQHQNMFLLDSSYHISSVIKSDKLDQQSYAKLGRRIRVHQDFIRKYLPHKPEMCRNLELLKFIGFMVPLLIALKKRCKVPDINKLLPPFTYEECKTERELPPLILKPDFKCKNFDSSEKYCHLHGEISVDRETGEIVKLCEKFVVEQENLEYSANDAYNKIVTSDTVMLESYPMRPVVIDSKSYYVLNVHLETYYPMSPKQPLWIHSHYDEIAKLRKKRLPMHELQVHEQFRKRYGYQRTVKLKQIIAGLQATSQRGLVAAFYTLSRRMPPSRLGTQDASGLSLVHYAAMYNRPQIITMLVSMTATDINVRRYNNISSQGITPLHVAAKCGALDSLSCLIAYKADLMMIDSQGWAPVHYAAYFNHVDCLQHLVRKQPKLVELKSTDHTSSTPILLASSSGALDTVKFLIDLDVDYTITDANNNGAVHLAALHFHNNILEYFIEWNNNDLPVWDLLVGMLKSNDIARKDKATKCLEVLSVSMENNWKSIMNAGGVPALVALLSSENEDLIAVAASVLCNIASHHQVRVEITLANAIPVLVQLLGSTMPMTHSRAAVILADLSCLEDNQELVSTEGGIQHLVQLLESQTEHVLVNAVNALRVLCEGNCSNQTAIAQSGAVEILIQLLGAKSKKLQANTAAAICALAKHHHDNQDLVVEKGGVVPLVTLARSKTTTCQVKAASALEALAENNPKAQVVIDEADAPKPLIRLLKKWETEVKEQSAGALWALAGSVRRQQQRIATMIGISTLVEMLMTSERLQYIAGMAMISLVTENIENQNKIVRGDGIRPLVRLLRSRKTSQKVLLIVIRVLGILCVGVAHQSNHATQLEIANAEALVTLAQLLRTSRISLIQVEVAITLGKITLNNAHAQQLLTDQTKFLVNEILHLLKDNEEEVRLKAGMALATFAYNNTSQQYSIKTSGGVRLESFDEFIQSPNSLHQAHAAFHIVVLARVIVNSDQVTLSARGVELLVTLLSSNDYPTQIQSASLTASLSHTRAGIPAALITSGAVESLLKNLYSVNEEVRGSAAVALGYLSFNRTAARLMLVACRNTPGLYDILAANLGNGKMAMEFADDWQENRRVGLPSSSLEIHGGPRVQHKLPPTERRNRPHTTQSLPTANRSRLQRDRIKRIQSAPIGNSYRNQVKAGIVRAMTPSSAVDSFASSSSTRGAATLWKAKLLTNRPQTSRLTIERKFNNFTIDES